jgi:hypothetical protein
MQEDLIFDTKDMYELNTPIKGVWHITLTNEWGWDGILSSFVTILNIFIRNTYR